jgi:cobalt/nickel transport system permease protein
MLGVHALIGVGEALITVAALTFVLQTRPDLIGEGSVSGRGGRGWVVAGVIISLLVVLLSPFASANPDGLERVATDLGFINKGQSAVYNILPDYTLPALGGTPLSTLMAGVTGVLVVLVVAVVAGRSLQKRS